MGWQHHDMDVCMSREHSRVFLNVWGRSWENFRKCKNKVCPLTFLGISPLSLVRFWKFKNRHTQGKEPVVWDIMNVVRKACLSSPVTTWRQKGNTVSAVIKKGVWWPKLFPLVGQCCETPTLISTKFVTLCGSEICQMNPRHPSMRKCPPNYYIAVYNGSNPLRAHT